jgi:hypothetical protein
VGREAREDTPPGSAARGAREDTPPVPADPTDAVDVALEPPPTDPAEEPPKPPDTDAMEVVATVLGKRNAPDGDGDGDGDGDE